MKPRIAKTASCSPFSSAAVQLAAGGGIPGPPFTPHRDSSFGAEFPEFRPGSGNSVFLRLCAERGR